MPGRRTNARIKRATRRSQHHRSRNSQTASSSRLKRSHSGSRRKQSGARISSSRLREVRADLAGARENVSEAFHSFWIIPEHDIRETLARTQRTIDRAVEMLPRAA